MKRLIFMAVAICLSTGLTAQAQVKKGVINRAESPEQVVTASPSPQTKKTLNRQSAKQDKETILKNNKDFKTTDKDLNKKEGDNIRKDAYRKYRVAIRKAEKAQAKLDAAKKKIEKLEQERANERVSVAEKITSGNGLTAEEATALEKALLVVDEKYGAKIAAARTELESARIDLEHAQSYMETTEMEYKAVK